MKSIVLHVMFVCYDIFWANIVGDANCRLGMAVPDDSNVPAFQAPMLLCSNMLRCML